jgi:hypothetical protein
MSIFNLIPRKMDGSAVYGYERNGLYLSNRSIEEFFSLKGSVAGTSSIRFELDFDFKLLIYRSYAGSNGTLKLSLYENKSSSDAYEAYPLYLQDTALNTLITFVDSYHQKGTIIELKLDESTTTPVRFAILIQQCNFIDFPSL